jgi:hypothetical protein
MMTTNPRLRNQIERLRLTPRLRKGLRKEKQINRRKTMKIRSEKGVCGVVC